MKTKLTVLALLLLAGVAAYPQSTDNPPKPEWVPDPSAGHYDCPDGWIAYSRSEPNKYSDSMGPVMGIYLIPSLDKKGHRLKDRPPEPICVKEKP